MRHPVRSAIPSRRCRLICCILFLAVVQLPLVSQAQLTTVIYCEDFNTGDGGWTAIDVDAARRPTDVFWHLDGGDWFCATEDPCFVNPGPGYGNNWGQRLEKSYALPSAGPVTLDLHHEFDAENGFDFCTVQVLPEGGGDAVEVDSFTGASGGIVGDVIDLGAYAGTTVTIRFQFTSDNAFSDQDGLHSSSGAWRIDRLTVSGYAEEDFGSEQGWVATAIPLDPTLATLRLDPEPRCDPADYLLEQGIVSLDCDHPSPCGVSSVGGNAWVAFDPVTGLLPEVPADYNRNFIPGIESPVIPIPPPVGTSEYRLEVDVFEDQRFQDTRVVWQQNLAFPVAGDPCPARFTRENQWNSLRAEGWNNFVRPFDPPPGATNVQVRLNIGDWVNLTGATPGTGRGRGPYFDNVRIVHVTAPPGPPFLECKSDFVVGTGDCDVTVPEIGIGHPAILRVLDDTTPRDQLVVNQSPAPGTMIPSGGIVTISITDLDGLTSTPCDVRLWNFTPPEVTILDVDPPALWPPNHKLVPTTITFQVGTDCSAEPEPELTVLVSSSEPDYGTGKGDKPGDVGGSDGYTSPVELSPGDIVQNLDGSYSATVSLRAERSGQGEGRIYRVTVLVGPEGARGEDVFQVQVPHDQATTFVDPSGTLLVPDVNPEKTGVGEGEVTEWGGEIARYGGVERKSVRRGKWILELWTDYGSTSPEERVAIPRESASDGFVSAFPRTPASVYPNPFTASTTIQFTLEQPEEMVLSVLDPRGRLVRRLARGPFAAGSHNVVWNGRDERGRPAALGVYFIELRGPRVHADRKVVLVR